MSDPLRNLFDKSKPLFEGKGRFARFFPLFDVFENIFLCLVKKIFDCYFDIFLSTIMTEKNYG